MRNTDFRINPHESTPVQRYLSIISVESRPFYREALPIPITSVEAPCDLGPIEISPGCRPFWCPRVMPKNRRSRLTRPSRLTTHGLSPLDRKSVVEGKSV